MHCVAIDDEPIALELLKNYISKIPFLELNRTFTDPIEAMDYLTKNKVDLIFSDIEMKDITGVQLISCLKQKPMIIFTSDYERYAIDGYGYFPEVVDYLSKPFTFERFLKAVSKAYEIFMQRELAELRSLQSSVAESENACNNQQHPVQLQQKMPADYIFVKSDSRLVMLKFADVLFIEGFGDYIKIHLINGKPLLSLQNLSAIEDKLPAGRFARVHRSFIVSVEKIETIERKRIRIGNQIIPISDTYCNSFFSLVNN